MKNTKVIHKFFFVVLMILLLAQATPRAMAIDTNTAFNVNVQEYLSVSITTPSEWASGSIGTFLRNKVSLSVTSNNASGFTASMTTKTTETALVNAAKSTITLPRLAANTTRNNFPANRWGYSLNDTEAGSGSSNYRAVPSSAETPVQILSSAVAATSSKDFYFGAKANVTQASGTYTGTVVISVVSGVIDDNTNPLTPVDPVTPGNEQTATYDSGRDTTAYTYRSTGNGGSTTTTEITSGDHRSAYQGYTPPQGVTYSTTASLGTGTAMATGFGIAASVAATSGFFFLAAARREGDDEDQA
ncbi:hypothetical protein IKF73_03295 [Candidatus Saccharibacteria bacterium]|nr:hypothetical protein [Candidatus Saccharibacteria bacterium]